MINKTFVASLKKEHSQNTGERRQIISLSNVVLHDAKRVIFSLHRNELKNAENSLAEIENTLRKLETKFSYNRLKEEGSYKAGVEEYVEAKMLYLVMSGEKVDKIKGIRISFESYVGGVCDLIGELVRLAVNRVTAGKPEDVVWINTVANDIMAELVEFDMTGYLRTKYDQARGHLRKIEQINYEVKLRKLDV